MFPVIDLRSQAVAINNMIIDFNITDEMLNWLALYGVVGINIPRQHFYEQEFGTNICRYKSVWGFVAFFYFDENKQILFDTVVWR